MKKVTQILLVLLAVTTTNLIAQNAPVSTVGNVSTNGSTAIVPITVTNFNSIGSCNLVLHFDPSIGTVSSVTANSLLQGSYNVTIGNSGPLGSISIGWYNAAAVTVPDNTPVFYINFTKVSNGVSQVTWDSDNTLCVYTNSIYGALNDIPLSTYYIPGSVSFQDNAPVSSIGSVSTCSGTVSVPVTVSAFNNIGAFSLSLNYNPSVLSFTPGTNSAGFEGLFITNPVAGIILIGGYSSSATGVTYPDNTELCKLNFIYLGGSTNLNWFEDDIYSTCQWSGPLGIPATLNDLPQSTYYHNGSVQGDKQFQLSLKLEGLYNTGTHKMNYAKKVGGNQYPGTTVEQVTVELNDATSYGTIVYTAENVNLTEDGEVSLCVPVIHNGSYYITIKHRNSIKTVSALPVSFVGNTIIYSFDAASKAYGGNLKQMSDGAWVIYSGDINQDGIIDAGDMIPLDNDAASFVNGYVTTDLNGNGTVGPEDMILLNSNAENFIGLKKP